MVNFLWLAGLSDFWCFGLLWWFLFCCCWCSSLLLCLIIILILTLFLCFLHWTQPLGHIIRPAILTLQQPNLLNNFILRSPIQYYQLHPNITSFTINFHRIQSRTITHRTPTLTPNYPRLYTLWMIKVTTSCA